MISGKAGREGGREGGRGGEGREGREGEREGVEREGGMERTRRINKRRVILIN